MSVGTVGEGVYATR